MTNPGPTEASSNRNLKRLFVLRNLLVSGGLLALFGAHHLIDTPLPLQPLLTIIGALALLNIWTWHRVRSAVYISDAEFFLQLSMDVFALAAVLYLTGGASNPFAWFFLIPLIITATVLSPTATWLMAALTTACYTLLLFFFQPLGETEHMHHNDSFAQHVFGMWFGFVLSAVLIAWFVVGMANTLKRRDQLLAAAREQSLRDERLVALGTLATGAAHELGTPLATMAVITRELERAEVNDSMRKKLRILRDQVDRCKQALSIISASAGEARAESGSLVSVENFLNQVITAWKQQHTNSELKTRFRPGSGTARILNEYTLHQALINLLNNASDASTATVVMEADWNETQLTIRILDRGPGLHPATTSQLGQHKPSDKEYGMGLGLFLTHATLQRLGGNIVLSHREGGGTCTSLSLPLTKIDLPDD
jgi:two-component system sensor histidine kinase RegB